MNIIGNVVRSSVRRPGEAYSLLQVCKRAWTFNIAEPCFEHRNARAFSPDDRLYRVAFKAQAAMGELVMVLHYLTCDGVGDPTRETDSDTTE